MKPPSKTLLMRIHNYKQVLGHLDRLEADKEELRAWLVKHMPEGVVNGLRKVRCSEIVPDEALLRKLGFWRDVAVERADLAKARCLLRLHPELEAAGALTLISSWRLLFKETAR
jgi:hypothetical protein